MGLTHPSNRSSSTCLLVTSHVGCRTTTTCRLDENAETDSISRLKVLDPRGQDGDKKQRSIWVLKKRDIRKRYEGYFISSLPKGRSLGSYHPFNRQRELQWKISHLCYPKVYRRPSTFLPELPIFSGKENNRRVSKSHETPGSPVESGFKFKILWRPILEPWSINKS